MAVTQYQHGKMDISSNREMWKTFVLLTKWLTGSVVIIVGLMAIFLA